MTKTNHSQVVKGAQHHFDNLIRLDKKPKPSKKELEEMYSYLDYCFVCGKKITFWDRISFNVEHGFSGNAHRRDCK